MVDIWNYSDNVVCLPLCVRGIELASFYDLRLNLRTVCLFVFHFIRLVFFLFVSKL